MPRRNAVLWSAILWIAALAPQTASALESNLKAAAARIDITPPEGTPVVGHVRPVNGVRDPISAALLVLDDGRTKAALVTLDLINAGADITPRLRQAISAAASIESDNILISTSHNHSG